MALTPRWSLALLALFLGLCLKLPIAKAQYIMAPESQEYDYVSASAIPKLFFLDKI